MARRPTRAGQGSSPTAAAAARSCSRSPPHGVARPRRAARARGHRRWTIRRPAARARRAASRRAPLVALDTETAPLEPHDAELVGLSLAASPTEVWYLPFGHRPRGGELAAPAPVRNLPPLDRRRARAARRAAAPTPRCPRPATTSSTTGRCCAAPASSWPAWPTTRCSRASCSIPAAAPTRIDTLCLEHLGRADADLRRPHGQGEGADPVRRGADRGGRGLLRRRQRDRARAARLLRPRAHARSRLEPLLRDIEMPLVEVLVDMEWEGIAIDRDALRAAGARARRRTSGRLEARDRRAWRAATSTSTRRGSSRTVLFEKHQLPVLKKTKTGPSHRRRRARAARRDGPRAAAAHPRVPRAAEAQEHLRRHAARPGQPPHRADPHQLQPDRRRHRPAQLRPIPTCRTSRSAPRAARRSAAASFPGPAGSSWWPTIRRSSCASWRTSRAIPAFIEAFRQGGDIHRQTAALIFNVPVERGDAGDARPGQDDQLRHHLRPGPVRAEPPARHLAGGGEDLHRAVLRALRRGARLPRPAGAARARAGLRGDASSSAAATSPRSRTATSTCAPTASAPRRTPRSRARRPT